MDVPSLYSDFNILKVLVWMNQATTTHKPFTHSYQKYSKHSSHDLQDMGEAGRPLRGGSVQNTTENTECKAFSHPNWDSPTPHTKASVYPSPHLVPGGTHACGRKGAVWESQFGRGERHYGTLGTIYVLSEWYTLHSSLLPV